MSRRTIVVSAVNLVEAGTLAILRDCLSYLSTLAIQEDFRVVAIVYKKEMANFPNIEYIETQWPKKRWVNRLWYEYVSLRRISKNLSPVYLWLSLHDTSPSVRAERRAVYCHNAFSFYKWRMHDLLFAPKIALFAMFTKCIYKTNIKENTYVVVQQQWFKEAMRHMFSLDFHRIIVAPPQRGTSIDILSNNGHGAKKTYTFLFAGSPNSHKNFDIVCRAAAIVEKEGYDNFNVLITVKGDENRYARWLHKRWGQVKALNFMGFVSKAELERLYQETDCLLFPSKVETWGLPISEFASLKRPMLLAGLPYARETAAGSKQVAFFDPDQPAHLADQMKKLIRGDRSFLQEVPPTVYKEPMATSWDELFSLLLTDQKRQNNSSLKDL
ncbi:glycosyltransferase [Sphingobacterium suaedae]|uniref:Glycosyltransferase n=1 Tax=Sphingobacterium suaedae TaxID=1686402 RepID=A0ABW5KQB6_9SPHI